VSRRDDRDADRRLEQWLARAPRLPASPAFRARVMRAIEPAPAPLGARLRAFLFRPHTLRWNVGGLALAGVTGIAVALAWTLHRPVVVPPAEEGLVSVRFVLHQPGARQVRLAGDFTGWQARVPLARSDGDRWVAELRLAPGHYEYVFVVDGERWVDDPAATRFRDDGFGRRNALLTVTAPRPEVSG
jgi:hypothetical protein